MVFPVPMPSILNFHGIQVQRLQEFYNIEHALKIFLLCFKPRRYWIKCFNDSYNATIFMFYRPMKIINGKVQVQAKASFWWKFPISILSMEEEYSEAQRIIFQ